jgi:hypothetical protein
MKTLCVILFLMGNPDLSNVRSLYLQSPDNKQKTEQLLTEVKKYSHELMIYKGYEGVATMMLAKQFFNPYDKLSFFNKGKSLLEEAISKDSLNIELRYLRLIVQQNAPFFLGYNSMIVADKEFIVKNISQIQDNQLINLISTALNK